jgi:hypothetical protein
MNLVFETHDGERYDVALSEIQSLTFMGADVFVLYTAGDCDVLAPYVTL